MTMPQVEMAASRRGAVLPRSPIRRLAPLAQAAEERGLRLIRLNIGQPDLAPPESVVQALQQGATEPLVYTPSRGIPEALNAWVAYYRHHGIEIEPNDVIVTGGGSEALSLAVMSTCDPGDEVLIPEPFYAPFGGVAALAGVKLIPIPMGPNFAPPSVDVVRERITDATRALLICSPNNPTGTVYTRDDLAALGALARDHGLFIISDETYREIVFDGPAAPSILSIPGLDDHALVVDSVSKRFNACGIRIGSLVSRNAEVMQAAHDLAELRLSLPGLTQNAMRAALEAPEPYVSGVVASYRERIDAVVTALDRIPGASYHRPGGAFYVVAQLPVDDTLEFASWMLTDFEHNGETVVLTPMSSFYLTPGKGDNEVRIACVYDPETMTRAVEIIGAGLEAYRQQRAS